MDAPRPRARPTILAAACALSVWLVASSASANDGLGALAEMVGALLGALVCGLLPGLLLLVSFFFFRRVRGAPRERRRVWPWIVLAIALAGHVGVAVGAFWIAKPGSRGENAAELAAVLCSCPFFVLTLAAVITAFIASRGPKHEGAQAPR